MSGVQSGRRDITVEILEGFSLAMEFKLMRRVFVAALLCLSLASCSQRGDEEKPDVAGTDVQSGQDEPFPPEVRVELKAIAGQQAEGLKEAVVRVYGAYEYHGYSFIQPVPSARLVAVDVEFSCYNAGFDLDDVDIIDGRTDENYGSDPHIALLSSDGVVQEDDSKWPEAPGPIRVLLIYAMPRESVSVKLGYWGTTLTSSVVSLVKGGPSLKEPAE